MEVPFIKKTDAFGRPMELALERKETKKERQLI